MADVEDACNGDVVDLSNRGLRIGSIFIVMAAATFGAFAPILLARQQKMHVPKFTFFICKYVGTGVIIATAWMHLLDPAVDNLSDPCLAPRLGDYPWALCISLMTVMVMFFVELLAARIGGEDDAHSHSVGSDSDSDPSLGSISRKKPQEKGAISVDCPHDAHLAHGHEHDDGDSHGGLAGQLTAIFILEFGVVFHSVFIGLTLGTTDDLVVLLVVLVFHQMFEGLGLGSRLATAPWPKKKQWMPYLLGFIFALSTPIGTAAGIGARPNNANTQKLVNGIFDSISAGILMYTGLVELLAHEFMFNPQMRKAPLKVQLFAFGCVAFGVAIMSLLAKWA
ncbi:ZIP zinc/iron transport family [Trichoderma citrinoviride]|uniref:ZIP zinc/iron transport family n=1 Tax=Trichoderma citrinoviride TaxID=58853 RepID=A0A2T4BAZ5_9HYPO|nr:ZIP zinc/iron transport family [Trichoderma citrinoviride]PTB66487.1 ZIP zinc/iron transport family [Trichoderma citrinoviride]